MFLSSSSVSPANITYPPNGISLIIYSVSSFFLLKENNLGPNPNENSYTYIPFFLAIIKWPNSCINTINPNINKNKINVIKPPFS